jgi:hypothetical protein
MRGKKEKMLIGTGFVSYFEIMLYHLPYFVKGFYEPSVHAVPHDGKKRERFTVKCIVLRVLQAKGSSLLVYGQCG